MDNGNERKIDLTDLLCSVAEKWRILLLAACVGLLFVGAYKFYDSEKKRAENDELIAEGREEEVIYPTEYQTALDTLNLKKREISELETEVTEKQVDITKFKNDITKYNAEIDAFNKELTLYENEKDKAARQLKSLNTYIDQSVLQNIDAKAKPTARKRYQVIYDGSGTEEYYRDPVDEILAAYAGKITLAGNSSGLSEKYGIPEKYISEIYNVSYDAGSNTICVEANGTDEQMAKDVLTAVCAALESRKQGIESRYHAHTLKSIGEEYQEMVDDALAEDQKEYSELATTYSSDIASYETKILNTKAGVDNDEALLISLEQQIRDADNAIEELNEDILKIRKQILEDKLEETITKEEPSLKNSLKTGIKFGLVAAIAMGFLTAVFFGVVYVLDGKIHTVSDLICIKTIPVLAVLNRSERKQKCFVDRWIYKLRNKGCSAENDEIMKSGMIFLGSMLSTEKRIALLSTLDPDSVTQMAVELEKMVSDVKFVPLSESLCSSADVKQLQSVDGIVLYERRDESKSRAIRAEIEQGELLGKSILGSIVA